MAKESIDKASLLPFDAAFVSFPKCGRTWVRLMLGRLIALEEGRGERADDLDALFDVFEATQRLRGLPRVVFSHDDKPQHRRADELQPDKSKLYRGRDVVVLIRDLRDVMVSSFFQLTRREEKRSDPSLSAYVRSPSGAAETFVAFYNHWWAARGAPRSFHVFRYEDLHAHPEQALAGILAAIGWPPVAAGRLREVAAWAAFDNLRRKSLASQRRELQPRRADDPESFKMRRGRVGGFRDYLTPEDVAYLDAQMRRLEPGYGYAEAIDAR
jgi:hypothetical protein